MPNIAGLFDPYQAGGRSADIGIKNPYLRRHSLEPRQFQRFSASMAANLGSRSSIFNPSMNLSLSSLYYSPTARMGLPRSAEAIKMSIRGMMGTSIRTAMGYSTGHVPVIEGLHPGSNGYSKSMIQGMTAFGSGFDASKAVGFTLTNPVSMGFVNMLMFGKPTFASKRRMGLLSLYAGGLGYARAGLPGMIVGLGALAAIYGTANKIENRLQGQEERKPSFTSQMAEFMAFGTIAGALEAGASAGILGRTSPGRLLNTTITPLEHSYSWLANKFSFLPKGPVSGEAIPGLAPELQEWVSPLRKYYQKSILGSAASFERWGNKLGLDIPSETYLKFSEAFHGESAYVLREAAKWKGVEKIPNNVFYKALGKDIVAGAAGGLFEHTLVGAAYLGIGWGINKVFRGAWRHRVAESNVSQEPYTLPGLHPGNAGYATSYIRGMTSFGSKHDPFKAINLGELIYSPSAKAAREWVDRVTKLANRSDVNLIGFDIETGGLLPRLLPTTQLGAKHTNVLEFAIQSSRGQSYGFTKYASSELYGVLAAEEGDFAKQFAEAGERFRTYVAQGGKLYSSSAIATTISKHIIPGKTNILVGHNINWFDIPILTSDIALEKNMITSEQLRKLRMFGVPGKSNKEFLRFYDSVIRSGWQKANQQILKTWQQHDSNLSIIDTLGTTRTTAFTETMLPYAQAQLGLINQIQMGYYPGIHQLWHQHFYQKAIDSGKTPKLAARYAQQQAMFAAKVGTSAEESMKFFGMQFKGQAHNPIADVANELELLKSKALKSRLNAYSYAIDNKANEIIKIEHLKRLSSQQAKVESTLATSSIREGKLKLAREMSSIATESTSQYSNPILREGLKEGFGKWWEDLSSRGKLGWGLGITGVTYLGLKALFAPRTKYTTDQPNSISGLHPGNKGMATNIIRSQTDFGSGVDLAKMLLKRIWQSINGAEEAIKPEMKLIIDTTRYEPPKAIKAKIEHKAKIRIHEKPTVGLVNIVLNEQAITHHKSFNRTSIL